jgi:hypothetical protein
LETSGDFNGDGRADYAVIMPSRSGEARPLFLVALATRSGWRIQQLPIGDTTRVDRYVLRTLGRGTYHETEAVLEPGERGRTMTSTTDGILLASCESWASAYFYIRRHWFSLALSD